MKLKAIFNKLLRQTAPFFLLSALSVSLDAGSLTKQVREPLDFDLIQVLEIQISGGESNAPRLLLSLAAGGRRLDLALHETELLSPSAKTVWLGPDGPLSQEGSDAIFLSGRIVGDDTSQVRLTLYGDVMEGVLVEGNKISLVEPAARYFPNMTGDDILLHPLPDVSALLGDDACGVDHLTDTFDPPNPAAPRLSQAVAAHDSAGDVNGAQALRLLELRLVADSFYSARHGVRTADRMHSIIHQVSGIMERDLGIRVRVAETRISLSAAEDDLASTTTSSSKLLNEFAKSKPLAEADLAHLFTGRRLDSGILGTSRIGGVCSTRYGVGLSGDVDDTAARLVLTAHEIGHSLGARHDGVGSCAKESPGNIMWPYIDTQARTFSRCSQRAVQARLDWVPCVSEVSARPARAPQPIAPVGVVASSRLRFRWEEVEGMDRYYIEVFDENRSKIIASKTVQGNDWVPDLNLHTDRLYRWRIAVRQDDGLGEQSGWKSFSPSQSRWNLPRK